MYEWRWLDEKQQSMSLDDFYESNEVYYDGEMAHNLWSIDLVKIGESVLYRMTEVKMLKNG